LRERSAVSGLEPEEALSMQLGLVWRRDPPAKGTETKPLVQDGNDSEKDEDCIRKDETALSPGMQDQTKPMSSSSRQR